MSTVSLIFRILLLAASFFGLCAAVRVRFKLDPCIAPFTACCCIIVALMLGGMLGILKYVLYALYALGFAGLIYAYAVKKSSPSPALILACLIFAAFLIFRFRNSHFWTNDDVSHWGLVARHLLRYDRFPDGGDTYVFFQSYPLGLACFIYYILRGIVNTQAAQLIAQNFLLGCLFLPMFSLVENRKRIFYPICAALFFMFAALSLFQGILAADLPQPLFGMGAAAAIVRYRDDWKRAAVAALPALAAVAYVKNSGAYFALLTAVILICAAKRCGLRRRQLFAFAAACVAIPLLAYSLWYVHIQIRFPAALQSKHAVSISAYANELHSKSPEVILQIAVRQLRAFYHLEKAQALAVPLLMVMTVVLFFAVRRLPARTRRRYLQAFGFAVASYLIWYVLVFFMYVFSMPEKEALMLASFSRYNGTGLVYMDGIVAVLMFLALRRRDALPLPVLRLGSVASTLAAAVILALILLPGDHRFFSVVLRKYDFAYPQQCADLAALRRYYDLPSGERYLVACYYDEQDVMLVGRRIYYNIKYEFETANIDIVGFNQEDHPGEYIVGEQGDYSMTEEPIPFIADHIDDCAAMLILNEDPQLESQLAEFMSGYDGDTPVYRVSELPAAAYVE